MSSLTLITGTIDEAEDPFLKLNLQELYYERWDADEDDPSSIIVTREMIPIKFYNDSKFRVVQYLGSGKTLKGMDILSHKVVFGGRVCANLGLVWDNEGKPKDQWDSSVMSFDDLENLDHCTVLIDDIKGTILKWNVKEADIVSKIANAGRKTGLDIIVTAQREKMIPPELRDIATEWIVPIIRVRDFTRETPDNTGYPIEMICLHFDGSKIFKFMSEPIIGLEPLFASYSTLQKAIALRQDNNEGARANQPGYALECKAVSFLDEKTGLKWEHLNGKHVFDVISDTHAFDIVGTDPDGFLYLDHKDLTKHIRTAKRKGQKPYLMYEYANEWRFVPINSNLNDLVEGKRINPSHLAKRARTLDNVMC